MPNPEDRLVPRERPERRPPTGVGGWLRRLFTLALLVAVVVLALPLALQHGLRLLLERESGQPVRVGAVRFLPAEGALELVDLQVGGTEPAPLRIRRATLGFDASGLLEARLGFGRLQLEETQVSVEQVAGGWRVGGLPLADWERLPLAGGLNAQDLTVRFESEGGALDLRLEQLFLEHLAANRPARFSLTGRLGEGRLQAEGLADLAAAHPNLSGELRLRELPVALLADLAGASAAQGQLELRTLFETRADPALGGWPIRLHETRVSAAKAALTLAGGQIQGDGEWNGDGSLLLGSAGVERLAAHGILSLSSLALDEPDGLHLAASTLRWEGAAQQSDEGWTVDGDARLSGASFQSAALGAVAAQSVDAWGVGVRPDGGWRLGRMRLQQARAGAGADAMLPLDALELEGLVREAGALPELERLRLLGFDATLESRPDGWWLQGLALDRLPPLRLAQLEVGGGSRLRLMAEGRPLAALDEVQAQLAGLDGTGGDPAQLQLHARLGGGTVYAGFDLRPGGTPLLSPQQVVLEEVPLAALSGALSRWFGVRADGGTVGVNLRRVGESLKGEAILQDPLLAAVQPDPFRNATGRDVAGVVTLLREADGNVHLPVTASLAEGADAAVQLGEVFARALEEAYKPVLAGPVDPRRLDDLKLAPLPAGAPLADAAAQMRLAQLLGALSSHPQAALWICAGEADGSVLRSTLVDNGVSARRLVPCPGNAAPGQVAWGLD